MSQEWPLSEQRVKQ